MYIIGSTTYRYSLGTLEKISWYCTIIPLQYLPYAIYSNERAVVLKGNVANDCRWITLGTYTLGSLHCLLKEGHSIGHPSNSSDMYCAPHLTIHSHLFSISQTLHYSACTPHKNYSSNHYKVMHPIELIQTYFIQKKRIGRGIECDSANWVESNCDVLVNTQLQAILIHSNVLAVSQSLH